MHILRGLESNRSVPEMWAGKGEQAKCPSRKYPPRGLRNFFISINKL